MLKNKNTFSNHRYAKYIKFKQDTTIRKDKFGVKALYVNSE